MRKGEQRIFSVNKIIPAEEKYKLKIFFYLTMLDIKKENLFQVKMRTQMIQIYIYLWFARTAKISNSADIACHEAGEFYSE